MFEGDINIDYQDPNDDSSCEGESCEESTYPERNLTKEEERTLEQFMTLLNEINIYNPSDGQNETKNYTEVQNQFLNPLSRNSSEDYLENNEVSTIISYIYTARHDDFTRGRSSSVNVGKENQGETQLTNIKVGESNTEKTDWGTGGLEEYSNDGTNTAEDQSPTDNNENVAKLGQVDEKVTKERSVQQTCWGWQYGWYCRVRIFFKLWRTQCWDWKPYNCARSESYEETKVVTEYADKDINNDDINRINDLHNKSELSPEECMEVWGNARNIDEKIASSSMRKFSQCVRTLELPEEEMVALSNEIQDFYLGDKYNNPNDLLNILTHFSTKATLNVKNEFIDKLLQKPSADTLGFLQNISKEVKFSSEHLKKIHNMIGNHSGFIITLNNAEYDFSANNYNYRIGDFNGDGLEDIIHFVSARHIRILFSTGDEENPFDIKDEFSPWENYGIDINNYHYLIGDFDGDGKADLVHFIDDYYFNIWLSNGDGTFTIHTVNRPKNHENYPMGANNHHYLIGDFNKDGKMDLVHFVDENTVYVWLSNMGKEPLRIFDRTVECDGLFYVVKQPTIPAQYSVSANNFKFMVGDFNKDGMMDLIHFVDDDHIRVWFSNGDGTFTIKDRFVPKNRDLGMRYGVGMNNYNYLITDFDGDGMDDVIHFVDDYHIRVWLSNGDGTFNIQLQFPHEPPKTTPPSHYGVSLNNYTYKIGQFFKDSTSSLAHVIVREYNEQMEYYFHMWKYIGSGFFDLGKTFYLPYGSVSGDNFNHHRVLSLDMNGDKITDFIHLVEPNHIQILFGDGNGGFRVGKFPISNYINIYFPQKDIHKNDIPAEVINRLRQLYIEISNRLSSEDSEAQEENRQLLLRISHIINNDIVDSISQLVARVDNNENFRNMDLSDLYPLLDPNYQETHPEMNTDILLKVQNNILKIMEHKFHQQYDSDDDSVDNLQSLFPHLTNLLMQDGINQYTLLLVLLFQAGYFSSEFHLEPKDIEKLIQLIDQEDYQTYILQILSHHTYYIKLDNEIFKQLENKLSSYRNHAESLSYLIHIFDFQIRYEEVLDESTLKELLDIIHTQQDLDSNISAIIEKMIIHQIIYYDDLLKTCSEAGDTICKKALIEKKHTYTKKMLEDINQVSKILASHHIPEKDLEIISKTIVDHAGQGSNQEIVKLLDYLTWNQLTNAVVIENLERIITKAAIKIEFQQLKDIFVSDNPTYRLSQLLYKWHTQNQYTLTNKVIIEYLGGRIITKAAIEIESQQPEDIFVSDDPTDRLSQLLYRWHTQNQYTPHSSTFKYWEWLWLEGKSLGLEMMNAAIDHDGTFVDSGIPQYEDFIQDLYKQGLSDSGIELISKYLRYSKKTLSDEVLDILLKQMTASQGLLASLLEVHLANGGKISPQFLNIGLWQGQDYINIVEKISTDYSEHPLILHTLVDMLFDDYDPDNTALRDQVYNLLRKQKDLTDDIKILLKQEEFSPEGSDLAENLAKSRFTSKFIYSLQELLNKCDNVQAVHNIIDTALDHGVPNHLLQKLFEQCLACNIKVSPSILLNVIKNQLSEYDIIIPIILTELENIEGRENMLPWVNLLIIVADNISDMEQSLVYQLIKISQEDTDELSHAIKRALNILLDNGYLEVLNIWHQIKEVKSVGGINNLYNSIDEDNLEIISHVLRSLLDDRLLVDQVIELLAESNFKLSNDNIIQIILRATEYTEYVFSPHDLLPLCFRIENSNYDLIGTLLNRIDLSDDLLVRIHHIAPTIKVLRLRDILFNFTTQDIPTNDYLDTFNLLITNGWLENTIGITDIETTQRILFAQHDKFFRENALVPLITAHMLVDQNYIIHADEIKHLLELNDQLPILMFFIEPIIQQAVLNGQMFTDDILKHMTLKLDEPLSIEAFKMAMQKGYVPNQETISILEHSPELRNILIQRGILKLDEQSKTSLLEKLPEQIRNKLADIEDTTQLFYILNIYADYNIGIEGGFENLPADQLVRELLITLLLSECNDEEAIKYFYYLLETLENTRNYPSFSYERDSILKALINMPIEHINHVLEILAFNSYIDYGQDMEAQWIRYNLEQKISRSYN